MSETAALTDRLRGLDYSWGKRIVSDEPEADGLLENAAAFIEEQQRNIDSLKSELSSLRSSVIEECARVLERHIAIWKSKCTNIENDLHVANAFSITVESIRALSSIQ